MSPFFVLFKMDSMQSYGTVYTERQNDNMALTIDADVDGMQRALKPSCLM